MQPGPTIIRVQNKAKQAKLACKLQKDMNRDGKHFMSNE